MVCAARRMEKTAGKMIHLGAGLRADSCEHSRTKTPKEGKIAGDGGVLGEETASGENENWPVPTPIPKSRASRTKIHRGKLQVGSQQRTNCYAQDPPTKKIRLRLGTKILLGQEFHKAKKMTPDSAKTQKG
jgi:hypothetical protein